MRNSCIHFFALIVQQTNNRVRQIATSTWTSTLVAGSGATGAADAAAGADASFSGMTGIALHPNGQLLFVSDTGNQAIRTIDLSTQNAVATLPLANLRPSSVLIDAAGLALYVATTDLMLKRVVLASNFVFDLFGQPTVSGSTDAVGTQASFVRVWW